MANVAGFGRIASLHPAKTPRKAANLLRLKLSGKEVPALLSDGAPLDALGRAVLPSVPSVR